MGLRLGYNGPVPPAGWSLMPIPLDPSRPMGTSSSQRSPATPEWERVRDLYRDGVRDPSAIASRIAQALDTRTREQMAGPGVALCLGALLGAARSDSEMEPGEGGKRSLLARVAAVRREAERGLASHRLGSRFSDLALDALGSATLQAMVGSGTPGSVAVLRDPTFRSLGWYARQGRLHELGRRFLAHDLDRCFRHFVTRDLPDFVGSSAVPTVLEAQALADAVAAHCRGVCERMPLAWLEEDLERVPGGGPLLRVELLRGPFREALREGLNLLGAGGGGAAASP